MQRSNIDIKIIFENCRIRRKNLNMVWIGYKKEFDSVLHSWIGN